MTLYPKIDSPCPYKNEAAAVLEDDFCRLCQRSVFDLSAMGENDRRAFLAGCGDEEVCVSYRFPLRPALAAAALAVAAVPMAAAAQEAPPAPASEPAASTPAPDAAAGNDYILVMGGIHDPSRARFVEDPAASSLPELPIVYEDAPAAPGGKAAAPAPARPGA